MRNRSYNRRQVRRGPPSADCTAIGVILLIAGIMLATGAALGGLDVATHHDPAGLLQCVVMVGLFAAATLWLGTACTYVGIRGERRR